MGGELIRAIMGTPKFMGRQTRQPQCFRRKRMSASRSSSHNSALSNHGKWPVLNLIGGMCPLHGYGQGSIRTTGHSPFSRSIKPRTGER